MKGSLRAALWNLLLCYVPHALGCQNRGRLLVFLCVSVHADHKDISVQHFTPVHL